MKLHSAVRLFRTITVFTTITVGALTSGIMPMGCGGTNKTLEEAVFHLDQCNATVEASLTSSCTPALNAATSVLTSDPTNTQAALISSSASVGLARLSILDFLSDLSTLGDANSGAYSQFRTFISTFEDESLGGDHELDIDALQDAKDVLDTLLDGVTVDVDSNGVATDPLLKRASFQLGVIQALDAYIRPVKIASGGQSNVANLTGAEATRALQDYIDADNNLIRGGLSGTRAEDILTPLRENYCRCSLQDSGFVASCLRDLMLCQLYLSDSNLVTPENDYNGNATTNSTDCATLLSPSGLTSCSDDDTE